MSEDLSHIKFHAPPAMAKMPNGQYYIVGIAPTEPFTPDRMRVLKEEYKRRKEEHRKLREQVSSKTFHIPSNSDATQSYEVIHHIDGSWSCSCKGFQFRKNCSHIEKAKGML